MSYICAISTSISVILTDPDQRIIYSKNISNLRNSTTISWDKVPTVELRRRLGIDGVVEVMRRGRLRWFGHVERKEVDDWVSACRNLEVAAAEVGAGQKLLGEHVWMGI